MTPDIFTRMRSVHRKLVSVAAKVGPLHTYWDDISEIDARTGFSNHKPLLPDSDADFLAHLEGLVSDKNTPEQRPGM